MMKCWQWKALCNEKLSIHELNSASTSRKTYLHNFDLLKPHFYIVKLGFTGVYIIFLFLLKNIDCGYLLEPPHQGCSNKYPQSMFWAEKRKISEFLPENFQFLVVKFSIYLNRRVFVISWIQTQDFVIGNGSANHLATQMLHIFLELCIM